MPRPRGHLLPVVLVVAAVLTGCQDDGGPEPGEQELGDLMTTLRADPPAARDFFTGGHDADADEAIDAADIPDDQRVRYLVAERSYDSDAVVDGLGAALLAATTRDVGDEQARSQSEAILDEAVTAAGPPEDGADTIDTRLRADLGAAAGDNLRTMFDAWATAASEQPRWSGDPVRGFLIEVGHDADGRTALEQALVAETERRLEAAAPYADPQRVVDEVGVPFGRMLGALTLGARDELDGDAGSTEAGDLFAAGNDRAEAAVRDWARERTDDAELRTALAGEVGQAYVEEFG